MAEALLTKALYVCLILGCVWCGGWLVTKEHEIIGTILIFSVLCGVKLKW